MSCQLPSLSDPSPVGAGCTVGGDVGDGVGVAVGRQAVNTITRNKTNLRSKEFIMISRKTVIYATINVSTASANSFKLLTFNTLLQNDAYFGMSLSLCHKYGGSGFNQMVRAARRLIIEKISRRGSL